METTAGRSSATTDDNDATSPYRSSEHSTTNVSRDNGDEVPHKTRGDEETLHSITRDEKAPHAAATSQQLERNSSTSGDSNKGLQREHSQMVGALQESDVLCAETTDQHRKEAQPAHTVQASDLSCTKTMAPSQPQQKSQPVTGTLQESDVLSKEIHQQIELLGTETHQQQKKPELQPPPQVIQSGSSLEASDLKCTKTIASSSQNQQQSQPVIDALPESNLLDAETQQQNQQQSQQQQVAQSATSKESAALSTETQQQKPQQSQEQQVTQSDSMESDVLGTEIQRQKQLQSQEQQVAQSVRKNSDISATEIQEKKQRELQVAQSVRTLQKSDLCTTKTAPPQSRQQPQPVADTLQETVVLGTETHQQNQQQQSQIRQPQPQVVKSVATLQASELVCAETMAAPPKQKPLPESYVLGMATQQQKRHPSKALRELKESDLLCTEEVYQYRQSPPESSLLATNTTPVTTRSLESGGLLDSTLNNSALTGTTDRSSDPSTSGNANLQAPSGLAPAPVHDSNTVQHRANIKEAQQSNPLSLPEDHRTSHLQRSTQTQTHADSKFSQKADMNLASSQQSVYAQVRRWVHDDPRLRVGPPSLQSVLHTTQNGKTPRKSLQHIKHLMAEEKEVQNTEPGLGTATTTETTSDSQESTMGESQNLAQPQEYDIVDVVRNPKRRRVHTNKLLAEFIAHSKVTKRVQRQAYTTRKNNNESTNSKGTPSQQQD